MKRSFASILLGVLVSAAAHGALHEGAQAPDFTADATLAGKPFQFSLADALKKGPVVLYFYPKAFTQGCTVEAHQFAEASEDFKEAGATIIGVSNDSIETLNKFSVSECRNKFAVAADQDQTIMKAYDAQLPARPTLASRTSYVISPNGQIVYTYSDMSPDKHVENTLAAVRKMAQEKENAAKAPEGPKA